MDYSYTNAEGQEVPVPHGVCICCQKPSVPAHYPYCLDCWGDWDEDRQCCETHNKEQAESLQQQTGIPAGF